METEDKRRDGVAMTAASSVLLALADRCEREEPSRALNIAIFSAIGLTEVQEKHCRIWCQIDGRTDLNRERYIAAWAPDFTTSLDAAVTLTNGHVWSAHDLGPQCKHANVTIEGVQYKGDWCETVVLALCAASLRAMAALR